MVRGRITQRKEPKTRTGIEIAESIVVAAREVLEANGIEHFTTNLVAERAGVSIGSLYQYFQCKEALLAELARRLERMTGALLLRILDESVDASLADAISRVVDALLDELGDLKLRQVLRREVPAQWVLPVSEEVDRAVRDKIAASIAQRSDVRDGPHALMAWVIGHAIEHVIEGVVLAEPALASSPVFRAELVELGVRYLRR